MFMNYFCRMAAHSSEQWELIWPLLGSVLTEITVYFAIVKFVIMCMLQSADFVMGRKKEPMRNFELNMRNLLHKHWVCFDTLTAMRQKVVHIIWSGIGVSKAAECPWKTFHKCRPWRHRKFISLCLRIIKEQSTTLLMLSVCCMGLCRQS